MDVDPISTVQQPEPPPEPAREEPERVEPEPKAAPPQPAPVPEDTAQNVDLFA